MTRQLNNTGLRNVRRLRLHPLYVALFVLGGQSGAVQAQDYFDPAFLGSDGAQVDLSQYEKSGVTPEGAYLVDIYVNQEQVASREVRFAKDDKGTVVPVLTVKDLQDMGVAVSQIASLKNLKPDDAVGDLAVRIPSAKVALDMSQLRLNISVPQADMSNRVGGYVDPKLWDEGIAAGVFNYTLNGSKTWMQSQYGQSGGYLQNVFGNVNGGLNAGAWRLRSTLTYADSTSDTGGMNNSNRITTWNNTYVQRDIQRLRGELTLGEGNTGSSVFDGIPFRGAQLVSSDDMLPSSQRGFAPIITGIANSNATVTVTQNGSVIYQASVAPGPFRITDIYQASTGGDLVVSVTESDGTKHVTTQAYSALPVMLRPGGFEYEVTTGRYHNGGGYSGSQNPAFMLGTLTYGLPHSVTLYGGVLGANNYQSAALGTGVSLGVLGALSIDATVASATLPDSIGDARGAAYRARYSKSMLSSGTTLDLTTYRYATRNYYSFQDVNTYGNTHRHDETWVPWMGERKRSSWQTTLSQTLGGYGSLYLRGSRDEYWGTDRVVNSGSIGFNSSIKGVSYGINYNIDHTTSKKGQGQDWPTNRQIAFNVSVPFSLFSNAEAMRSMSANYSLSHDNRGRTSQQTGLSGSMLNNKGSWSLSQNSDNQGNSNAGNAALNYSGDSGSLGIGYGYDSYSRNLNGNLSGGLLVHRHGIVLSQMMGDSVALVSAPGVAGVNVSSGGTATNRWGYAASPYLQNYQRNVVTLDPTTLPDGADIENTSVNVYPTRGAVVEAKFKTRIGRQAMLTLNHNGKPVPFGAIVRVRDSNGEDNSSIVGDAGMVYLSGLSDSGDLQVQWGRGDDQQCKTHYDLGRALEPNKDNPGANVVQQALMCH